MQSKPAITKVSCLSMNRPSEQYAELHELLGRLCNGELTPAEFQRLVDVMSESDEARRFYVQYLDMNDALHQMTVGIGQEKLLSELRSKVRELESLTTPAALTGLPIVEGPGDDVSGLSFPDASPPGIAGHSALSFIGRIMPWGGAGVSIPMLVALLLACAGLSVGLTAFVFTRNMGPRTDSLLAHQQAVPLTPVAYLTSANGCDWGIDVTESWRIGRSIQVGDNLILYQGVAEFRLANGVVLSIEGPASLVLASPEMLVLQYGKITTLAPRSAGNFSVIAGVSKLNIADAEVGVECVGSKLEIHSFSGLVTVSAVGRQVAGFEKIDVDEPDAPTPIFTTVPPGRSLIVSSERDALKVRRRGVARPEQFAVKMSMAGPLAITRAYVDAVLECQPIGYWRFESADGNILKNEIPGGTVLEARGELRLHEEGGNRALEFGLPGQDCTLYSKSALPKFPSNDYSIECWVKPSHVHWGGIAALVVNAKTSHERAGPFLGLNPISRSEEATRRVRFVQRTFDAHVPYFCHSAADYAIRRWQHLVATKDGAVMRLYVDGKLAASGPNQAVLVEKMHLLVGRSLGSRPGRLAGQLDELALYDRALTKQEILRHYECVRQALDEGAGRPASAPHPEQTLQSACNESAAANIHAALAIADRENRL
jgi:hypothetical protein